MSNWPLIEHLTNYLLKPRRGDPRQPTLWPSEASAVITNDWGEPEVVGRCRRSTYFRYVLSNYEFYPKYKFYEPLARTLKEKELPTERYLAWIWNAGNLFEDSILNLARDSGVFIDTQVNIYMPEFNVSGKIDLVAINPETHKYLIAEIKSVYGFGGNVVLGKPGERKVGKLGTPRHSNLMQIALYEWWYASGLDQFEHSRLIYGSRDTGRYAEYLIRTEQQEDGTINILYKGLAPNQTPEVVSPITINSILLDGYKYVQDHLDSGTIPPRDFELAYSDEHIQALYQRDELTKTDKAQYEKIQAREEQNAQRALEDKAPLKPLKPIKKGDWNCSHCQWRKVCYNEDETPKDI